MGWYEIRLTGPRRERFRLFCLLENRIGDELVERGLQRPAIAVIAGMRKPWQKPACTSESSESHRKQEVA